ncbi:MAG: hypothetical protein K6E28_11155 [Eubacterium sp.]|nr:hypothetical protein [Eubacterium sp.]
MSDREYNILFSKYNIAVAKAKDLQEQLDTKMEQWKKRDTEFDITERLIRELCESILAKDKNQMVLGKSHSWSSTPVNELINNAKNTFNQCNVDWTDMLRKLMDLAEDRLHQIEDLQEEVLFYKQRAGSGATLDEEEIKRAEAIEKKKKAADTSSMSPKAQQAQKSGKVRIEKAEELKEGLTEGKAIAIVEEEDDIPVEGEKTQSLHDRNVKDNATAKLTPRSIRSVHGPKAIKEKRERKEKIENAYDDDRLKDIEAKLGDKEWAVIKTLAKTERSKTQEIAAFVSDDFKTKGVVYSTNAIINSIRDLANLGLLKRQNITLPTGRLALCTFTADGAKVYKRKFGKTPSLTEWDKVISEHTTLEHGYGILLCAQLIRETEVFEEVNEWNRNNPVKIKTESGESNISFVPDIVCRDKNGAVTYIEYELNHYNQKEFNTKCRKILLATDRLNFIAPNNNTAIDLLDKIKKFVASEGNSNTLRHQLIRVTTALNIKGLDLRRDTNWMYSYKPIIDPEPKKNF